MFETLVKKYFCFLMNYHRFYDDVSEFVRKTGVQQGFLKDTAIQNMYFLENLHIKTISRALNTNLN